MMSSDLYQVLPADPLVDLVPKDTQQQAARLVQESFVAALRLSSQGEGEQLEAALGQLADRLREWSRLTTPEASYARLAMILAGLDQWGLAYSQVVGAAALGGLSFLLANLRDCLDLAEESSCQHFLDQIHDDEAAALSFKIDFRRELHLSLWHTMIATDDRKEADMLLKLLGGLLLALNRAMPTVGWRLIADTLATIQIRCLQHGLALEGMARETTEGLFGGLATELPEDIRDLVSAHSVQAVHAWREAIQH